MFDIDLWREIFQNLGKNKLRTILSGFTISFAILLFTLLFGIGNGLKHSFEKAFVDDAQNSIFIRSGRTSKPYKGMQSGRRVQLKNKTLNFIKDKYDNKVEYITARIYKNVQLIYKNEQASYSLRAVHPDHQFLEKTIIDEGRYINLLDLKKKSKVLVIGRLVKEDLFGDKNALGKFVNVSGLSYKIIGVFSDEGGDNEERLIYMPITTAQQIYGNNDYIDQINLTFDPKMSISKAIVFGNTLSKVLKEKLFIAPRDQSGLRVSNMAEATKSTRLIMFGLNIIILFIGTGTLIAGIIGISNIMVYIVNERTKELGIRKALGASPKSIITMILLESILVTALAGYFGLLLGTGILKLVGDSLEKYFIINPSVDTGVVIGATIVLILSGIMAGYLPAKRAARIKPIVALSDK
ncbi:MAG: ABC transporter permease [Flavobacteriaceae bacterium]